MTAHVFIATSLDGLIARPDGDLEWLFSRDDSTEDHGYEAFIKDKDAILMGRGTFEKVADFNPWPYSIPVYVLSNTLSAKPVPDKFIGKVKFLDVSPQEAMKTLMSFGHRRVYVDGGKVIQSFLRDKLITDMVITQVPVLIGEGKPLFGKVSEDISLRHLSTITFPSGLVQSKYLIL